MKTLGVLALVGLAGVVGGCAKQPGSGTGSESPMTVAPSNELPSAMRTIESGQYAARFEKARDTLRDLGFVLDRVDARAGVLETQPKGTAGLATPWDREQTSLAGEAEDLLQRQRRVIRVEFAPAQAAGADVDPGASAGADLRELGAAQPTTMRVSAIFYRWHQPGWRLDSGDVLLSTYTTDPELVNRQMTFYGVAERQDQALAELVAERVMR